MKIELTEQEVVGMLNELSEVPLKYSSKLYSFLSSKLIAARDSSEEEPKPKPTAAKKGA